MLQTTNSLENVHAKDIMTSQPKVIQPEALAVEALDRMRTFDISQLIVTNENNEYLGVLQLHDLIREGLI
jgi:arabinose-5-phosphate isomerase